MITDLQQSKLRPWIRTVSLVTVLAFTWTNVVWADGVDLLSSSKTQVPTGVSPHISPELLPKSLQRLDIPDSIGEIETSFQGTRDRMVIHIQDAHANEEAQRNIANLLKYLAVRHELGLVNLEGAEGELYTELFSFFPSKKARKTVADYFLGEGRLSGSEYAAIVERPELTLYGVENDQLYEENRKAYLTALDFKERDEVLLVHLDKVLTDVSRFVFSDDLRELVRRQKDFNKGGQDLSRHVRYLTNKAKAHQIALHAFSHMHSLLSVIELERKIDFEAAESEIETLIDDLKGVISRERLTRFLTNTVQFRLKKMKRSQYYGFLEQEIKTVQGRQTVDVSTVGSGVDYASIEGAPYASEEFGGKYDNVLAYLRYVQLYENIDLELFSEISELERLIKNKLFQSEEEVTVDRMQRIFDVTQKMFEFSLTKSDADFFYAYRDEFQASTFRNALEPLLAKYGFDYELAKDLEILDTDLKRVEQFYGLALQRDRILIQKAVEKMEQDDEKISVIVTGGFHTAGIEAYLREKDYSYLVVVPRITRAIDAAGEAKRYEDAIRERPMPIERLMTRAYFPPQTNVLNDPRFQLSARPLTPTRDEGARALRSEVRKGSGSFFRFATLQFFFERAPKKAVNEIVKEIENAIPDTMSGIDRAEVRKQVKYFEGGMFEESKNAKYLYLENPGGDYTIAVLAMKNRRSEVLENLHLRSANLKRIPFSNRELFLAKNVSHHLVPVAEGRVTKVNLSTRAPVFSRDVQTVKQVLPLLADLNLQDQMSAHERFERDKVYEQGTDAISEQLDILVLLAQSVQLLKTLKQIRVQGLREQLAMLAEAAESRALALVQEGIAQGQLDDFGKILDFLHANRDVLDPMKRDHISTLIEMTTDAQVVHAEVHTQVQQKDQEQNLQFWMDSQPDMLPLAPIHESRTTGQRRSEVRTLNRRRFLTQVLASGVGVTSGMSLTSGIRIATAAETTTEGQDFLQEQFNQFQLIYKGDINLKEIIKNVKASTRRRVEEHQIDHVTREEFQKAIPNPARQRTYLETANKTFHSEQGLNFTKDPKDKNFVYAPADWAEKLFWQDTLLFDGRRSIRNRRTNEVFNLQTSMVESIGEGIRRANEWLDFEKKLSPQDLMDVIKLYGPEGLGELTASQAGRLKRWITGNINTLENIKSNTEVPEMFRENVGMIKIRDWVKHNNAWAKSENGARLGVRFDALVGIGKFHGFGIHNQKMDDFMGISAERGNYFEPRLFFAQLYFILNRDTFSSREGELLRRLIRRDMGKMIGSTFLETSRHSSAGEDYIKQAFELNGHYLEVLLSGRGNGEKSPALYDKYRSANHLDESDYQEPKKIASAILPAGYVLRPIYEQKRIVDKETGELRPPKQAHEILKLEDVSIPRVMAEGLIQMMNNSGERFQKLYADHDDPHLKRILEKWKQKDFTTVLNPPGQRKRGDLLSYSDLEKIDPSRISPDMRSKLASLKTLYRDVQGPNMRMDLTAEIVKLAVSNEIARLMSWFRVGVEDGLIEIERDSKTGRVNVYTGRLLDHMEAMRKLLPYVETFVGQKLNLNEMHHIGLLSGMEESRVRQGLSHAAFCFLLFLGQNEDIKTETRIILHYGTGDNRWLNGGEGFDYFNEIEGPDHIGSVLGRGVTRIEWAQVGDLGGRKRLMRLLDPKGGVGFATIAAETDDYWQAFAKGLDLRVPRVAGVNLLDLDSDSQGRVMYLMNLALKENVSRAGWDDWRKQKFGPLKARFRKWAAGEMDVDQDLANATNFYRTNLGIAWQFHETGLTRDNVLLDAQAQSYFISFLEEQIKEHQQVDDFRDANQRRSEVRQDSEPEPDQKVPKKAASLNQNLVRTVIFVLAVVLIQFMINTPLWFHISQESRGPPQPDVLKVEIEPQEERVSKEKTAEKIQAVLDQKTKEPARAPSLAKSDESSASSAEGFGFADIAAEADDFWQAFATGLGQKVPSLSGTNFSELDAVSQGRVRYFITLVKKEKVYELDWNDWRKQKFGPLKARFRKWAAGEIDVDQDLAEATRFYQNNLGTAWQFDRTGLTRDNVLNNPKAQSDFISFIERDILERQQLEGPRDANQTRSEVRVFARRLFLKGAAAGIAAMGVGAAGPDTASADDQALSQALNRDTHNVSEPVFQAAPQVAQLRGGAMGGLFSQVAPVAVQSTDASQSRSVVETILAEGDNRRQAMIDAIVIHRTRKGQQMKLADGTERPFKQADIEAEFGPDLAAYQRQLVDVPLLMSTYQSFVNDRIGESRFLPDRARALQGAQEAWKDSEKLSDKIAYLVWTPGFSQASRAYLETLLTRTANLTRPHDQGVLNSLQAFIARTQMKDRDTLDPSETRRIINQIHEVARMAPYFLWGPNPAKHPKKDTLSHPFKDAQGNQSEPTRIFQAMTNEQFDPERYRHMGWLTGELTFVAGLGDQAPADLPGLDKEGLTDDERAKWKALWRIKILKAAAGFGTPAGDVPPMKEAEQLLQEITSDPGRTLNLSAGRADYGYLMEWVGSRVRAEWDVEGKKPSKTSSTMFERYIAVLRSTSFAEYLEIIGITDDLKGELGEGWAVIEKKARKEALDDQDKQAIGKFYDLMGSVTYYAEQFESAEAMERALKAKIKVAKLIGNGKFLDDLRGQLGEGPQDLSPTNVIQLIFQCLKFTRNGQPFQIQVGEAQADNLYVLNEAVYLMTREKRYEEDERDWNEDNEKNNFKAFFFEVQLGTMMTELKLGTQKVLDTDESELTSLVQGWVGDRVFLFGQLGSYPIEHEYDAMLEVEFNRYLRDVKEDVEVARGQGDPRKGMWNGLRNFFKYNQIQTAASQWRARMTHKTKYDDAPLSRLQVREKIEARKHVWRLYKARWEALNSEGKQMGPVLTTGQVSFIAEFGFLGTGLDRFFNAGAHIFALGREHLNRELTFDEMFDHITVYMRDMDLKIRALAGRAISRLLGEGADHDHNVARQNMNWRYGRKNQKNPDRLERMLKHAPHDHVSRLKTNDDTERLRFVLHEFGRRMKLVPDGSRIQDPSTYPIDSLRGYLLRLLGRDTPRNRRYVLDLLEATQTIPDRVAEALLGDPLPFRLEHIQGEQNLRNFVVRTLASNPSERHLTQKENAMTDRGDYQAFVDYLCKKFDVGQLSFNGALPDKLRTGEISPARLKAILSDYAAVYRQTQWSFNASGREDMIRYVQAREVDKNLLLQIVVEERLGNTADQLRAMSFEMAHYFLVQLQQMNWPELTLTEKTRLPSEQIDLWITEAGLVNVLPQKVAQQLNQQFSQAIAEGAIDRRSVKVVFIHLSDLLGIFQREGNAVTENVVLSLVRMIDDVRRRGLQDKGIIEKTDSPETDEEKQIQRRLEGDLSFAAVRSAQDELLIRFRMSRGETLTEIISDLEADRQTPNRDGVANKTGFLLGGATLWLLDRIMGSHITVREVKKSAERVTDTETGEHLKDKGREEDKRVETESRPQQLTWETLKNTLYYLRIFVQSILYGLMFYLILDYANITQWIVVIVSVLLTWLSVGISMTPVDRFTTLSKDEIPKDRRKFHQGKEIDFSGLKDGDVIVGVNSQDRATVLDFDNKLPANRKLCVNMCAVSIGEFESQAKPVLQRLALSVYHQNDPNVFGFLQDNTPNSDPDVREEIKEYKRNLEAKYGIKIYYAHKSTPSAQVNAQRKYADHTASYRFLVDGVTVPQTDYEREMFAERPSFQFTVAAAIGTVSTIVLAILAQAMFGASFNPVSVIAFSVMTIIGVSVFLSLWLTGSTSKERYARSKKDIFDDFDGDLTWLGFKEADYKTLVEKHQNPADRFTTPLGDELEMAGNYNRTWGVLILDDKNFTGYESVNPDGTANEDGQIATARSGREAGIRHAIRQSLIDAGIRTKSGKIQRITEKNEQNRLIDEIVERLKKSRIDLDKTPFSKISDALSAQGIAIREIGIREGVREALLQQGIRTPENQNALIHEIVEGLVAKGIDLETAHLSQIAEQLNQIRANQLTHFKQMMRERVTAWIFWSLVVSGISFLVSWSGLTALWAGIVTIITIGTLSYLFFGLQMTYVSGLKEAKGLSSLGKGLLLLSATRDARVVMMLASALAVGWYSGSLLYAWLAAVVVGFLITALLRLVLPRLSAEPLEISEQSLEFWSKHWLAHYMEQFPHWQPARKAAEVLAHPKNRWATYGNMDIEITGDRSQWSVLNIFFAKIGAPFAESKKRNLVFDNEYGKALLIPLRWLRGTEPETKKGRPYMFFIGSFGGAALGFFLFPLLGDIILAWTGLSLTPAALGGYGAFFGVLLGGGILGTREGRYHKGAFGILMRRDLSHDNREASYAGAINVIRAAVWEPSSVTIAMQINRGMFRWDRGEKRTHWYSSSQGMPIDSRWHHFQATRMYHVEPAFFAWLTLMLFASVTMSSIANSFLYVARPLEFAHPGLAWLLLIWMIAGIVLSPNFVGGSGLPWGKQSNPSLVRKLVRFAFPLVGRKGLYGYGEGKAWNQVPGVIRIFSVQIGTLVYMMIPFIGAWTNVESAIRASIEGVLSNFDTRVIPTRQKRIGIAIGAATIPVMILIPPLLTLLGIPATLQALGWMVPAILITLFISRMISYRVFSHVPFLMALLMIFGPAYLGASGTVASFSYIALAVILGLLLAHRLSGRFMTVPWLMWGLAGAILGYLFLTSLLGILPVIGMFVPDTFGLLLWPQVLHQLTQWGVWPFLSSLGATPEAVEPFIRVIFWALSVRLLTWILYRRDALLRETMPWVNYVVQKAGAKPPMMWDASRRYFLSFAFAVVIGVAATLIWSSTWTTIILFPLLFSWFRGPIRSWMMDHQNNVKEGGFHALDIANKWHLSWRPTMKHPLRKGHLFYGVHVATMILWFRETFGLHKTSLIKKLFLAESFGEKLTALHALLINTFFGLGYLSGLVLSFVVIGYYILGWHLGLVLLIGLGVSAVATLIEKVREKMEDERFDLASVLQWLAIVGTLIAFAIVLNMFGVPDISALTTLFPQTSTEMVIGSIVLAVAIPLVMAYAFGFNPLLGFTFLWNGFAVVFGFGLISPLSGVFGLTWFGALVLLSPVLWGWVWYGMNLAFTIIQTLINDLQAWVGLTLLKRKVFRYRALSKQLQDKKRAFDVDQTDALGDEIAALTSESDSLREQLNSLVRPEMEGTNDLDEIFNLDWTVVSDTQLNAYLDYRRIRWEGKMRSLGLTQETISTLADALNIFTADELFNLVENRDDQQGAKKLQEVKDTLEEKFNEVVNAYSTIKATKARRAVLAGLAAVGSTVVVGANFIAHHLGRPKGVVTSPEPQISEEPRTDLSRLGGTVETRVVLALPTVLSDRDGLLREQLSFAIEGNGFVRIQYETRGDIADALIPLDWIGPEPKTQHKSEMKNTKRLEAKYTQPLNLALGHYYLAQHVAGNIPTPKETPHFDPLAELVKNTNLLSHLQNTFGLPWYRVDPGFNPESRRTGVEDILRYAVEIAQSMGALVLTHDQEKDPVMRQTLRRIITQEWQMIQELEPVVRALYDPVRGLLWGDYDFGTGEVVKTRHKDQFVEDRSGLALAVALGWVPESSWLNIPFHVTDYTDSEGETYRVPVTTTGATFHQFANLGPEADLDRMWLLHRNMVKMLEDLQKRTNGRIYYPTPAYAPDGRYLEQAGTPMASTNDFMPSVIVPAGAMEAVPVAPGVVIDGLKHILGVHKLQNTNLGGLAFESAAGGQVAKRHSTTLLLPGVIHGLANLERPGAHFQNFLAASSIHKKDNLAERFNTLYKPANLRFEEVTIAARVEEARSEVRSTHEETALEERVKLASGAMVGIKPIGNAQNPIIVHPANLARSLNRIALRDEIARRSLQNILRNVSDPSDITRGVETALFRAASQIRLPVVSAEGDNQVSVRVVDWKGPSDTNRILKALAATRNTVKIAIVAPRAKVRLLRESLATFDDRVYIGVNRNAVLGAAYERDDLDPSDVARIIMPGAVLSDPAFRAVRDSVVDTVLRRGGELTSYRIVDVTEAARRATIGQAVHLTIEGLVAGFELERDAELAQLRSA